MENIIFDGNALNIGHTTTITKYPIEKVEKSMINILYY